MQYSLSMFWENRLTYYCLESFVLCESLIKHSKTCGECFKERDLLTLIYFDSFCSSSVGARPPWKATFLDIFRLSCNSLPDLPISRDIIERV